MFIKIVFGLIFNFYLFAQDQLYLMPVLSENQNKGLEEIIDRPLIQMEREYLFELKNDDILLNHLRDLKSYILGLTEIQTLKKAIWNFVFFISQEKAKTYLNEINKDNIGMVIYAHNQETKIWETYLVIKSNRSHGQVISTLYRFPLDSSLLDNLSRVNNSWVEDMVTLAPEFDLDGRVIGLSPFLINKNLITR